mmetsp:Transcript_81840/g.175329  ORF Transcript_81840/g.175329 Transcript_81840/m.175329 type:complete len:219 (-) Transcript_81840:2803-3459(-)
MQQEQYQALGMEFEVQPHHLATCALWSEELQDRLLHVEKLLLVHLKDNRLLKVDVLAESPCIHARAKKHELSNARTIGHPAEVVEVPGAKRGDEGRHILRPLPGITRQQLTERVLEEGLLSNHGLAGSVSGHIACRIGMGVLAKEPPSLRLWIAFRRLLRGWLRQLVAFDRLLRGWLRQHIAFHRLLREWLRPPIDFRRQRCGWLRQRRPCQRSRHTR